MIDRIVLFSIPIEELRTMIGEIVEEKLKELIPLLVTTSPPQKEFISAEEVCEMLRINKVTLWRYTRDGRLKQHRIGRRVFFRVEEVRNALKFG
ncbi:MAG: helix-turn-helix domain-containing protein [Bacteroidetes bacterium]|nr:helix-turn-helix domain-containing protein [Bacteroidota bacterium]